MSSPAARFVIEQRGPDYFAVLGPNPDAGKVGVSYSGEYLTICVTDGHRDALMIARALSLSGSAERVVA